MAKTTEHKEGTATVCAVYYRSKMLADGNHPFMLRITKDRVRKYIATGLSLHPKFWNDEYTGYRQAIRKSYGQPHRDELIEKLSEWEVKYSSAAKALSNADEVHDVLDIANRAIDGRKQARKYTVLEYLTEQIANMQRVGKTGYSGVYQDLKNQLTVFIKNEYGKTDVRFPEINVKFCNGFEMFFRERSNADTSLSVRFRTLRTLYNRAIAEGAAKPEDYPFSRNVAEKHKFNVGKFDTSTRKRAITREEVRRIESFVPVSAFSGRFSDLKNRIEIERLNRAKDIFLFSFYVAGINFVDLSKLRWKDITTDENGNCRISYTRQKTSSKLYLKLLQPAVNIIEQYRVKTYYGPESYIFPILDIERHLTPNQVKYRLTKILRQVNQDLKVIGTQLNIKASLTTYVARHSFATSLRRSGTADEITGQLLGHKDLKQTSIYLDEFESATVDAAMENLL